MSSAQDVLDAINQTKAAVNIVEGPVLEFELAFLRVSMTSAASYSSVRTRLSPHFEMPPV